jgi:hypothetical protein
VAEEGWYSDPFQLHEHRWFSDGTPTALVRDGGDTSQDPPSATPYVEEPKPVASPPSIAADDLRRGGEAEDGSIDAVDAVWSYIVSRPSGF